MYSLTNASSSETIGDFVQRGPYDLCMSLNQRIFKARTAAKMTQQQLADAVGKTRGAVAQWESGEVQPRKATLEAIAKATDVSIWWLERGLEDLPSKEPVIGLPVVGEVSAGVWREGTARYEKVMMPVATHPDYPGTSQRLFKVVGDSINRVVDSGEFLHTVELHGSGIKPEHGDLVIVCRQQHGMAEYTAKQMIWDADKATWVLRPLSENPDWQDDIPLEGDDGTEIHVTDLVIAKWAPIPRRSLVPKDRNPFR